MTADPAAGFVWDETLYQGSAAYYRTGRVAYPAEIGTVLRRALSLDGTGRLLDCGCGPGSLTLLLAPLFESAVGIDADRGMVKEAAAAAAEAGQANVSWRELRAEQLPAGLGTFRLITFAQSFHWVDQPVVAPLLRGMLSGGGALVIVWANTHWGATADNKPAEVPPDGPPRPPWERVDDLIRHYLGEQRRAGRSLSPNRSPSDAAAALRGAGFTGPEAIDVPGSLHSRTDDDIVAAVFSLSYATPHLFGERKPAFERDLREVLRAASPDGRFTERMREIRLDIWRVP